MRRLSRFALIAAALAVAGVLVVWLSASPSSKEGEACRENPRCVEVSPRVPSPASALAQEQGSAVEEPAVSVPATPHEPEGVQRPRVVPSEPIPLPFMEGVGEDDPF